MKRQLLLWIPPWSLAITVLPASVRYAFIAACKLYCVLVLMPFILLMSVMQLVFLIFLV